jgi:hypothetical protein
VRLTPWGATVVGRPAQGTQNAAVRRTGAGSGGVVSTTILFTATMVAGPSVWPAPLTLWTGCDGRIIED